MYSKGLTVYFMEKCDIIALYNRYIRTKNVENGGQIKGSS